MNFPFKIPTDRKFDVVGFGTNSVDHLIRVAQFPEPESKMQYSLHEILPGGEVASTMVGLRRLGFASSYIGRFGDDAAGEIGISSLVDEGVDTTLCEKIVEAETQSAFILIDEGSGERTILWRRDPKLAYLSNQAPIHSASLGRVLHMTPHDTAACVEMANVARGSGTIVSLDIDNNFDGIENLLPLVGVLLTSADFANKLTGINDPLEALTETKKRFGCAIVGTTLGSKGSLVLCGDEIIVTPAFEVPGGCVDTTGAGDAFRTGFLYGMLSGSSVEGACLAANAVAALKCRKIGARTALPNLLEHQALLKRGK